MNRQPYARHSTAPVETPGELLNNANPYKGASDWVATVVNPATEGTAMQKGLFWIHILVWVISLALGSATNFGVVGLQAKVNDSTTCNGNNSNCFLTEPDQATITIGIIGGISTILGVIALLGGAALLDAEAFKKQVALNVVIQFLTLYGTSATFYVWTETAMKDQTGAFWLGLFACLFMLYSQVLLYCTSAKLKVMALPRAFLPCFAASVQLISAIVIQEGAWGPHSQAADGTWTYHHFEAGQKTVAWLVPITMLVSVALMVGLRRMTRDAVTDVSELGEYPFLRSLVLFPFLLSSVLAVYKVSFLKSDANPTGFMFGMIGMLLNFAIVAVVFIPSGMSANANDAAPAPMERPPMMQRANTASYYSK